MKKCPVCGVMMGDNVARCFMCKYDFQKAAREGEEAARKEATVNVVQAEKDNSGRTAEKKAESEKMLAEAREKNRIEIAAMERQLEGEKLRLEQEYVEIRKKALEERSNLDSELEEIRKQAEEESNRLKEARAERERLIEKSKADAQGEAAKIIEQIHEETNRLALQVQAELAEAMNQKQKILDEAARLEEEAGAARKKCEDAQQEYDLYLQSLEEDKRKARDEAAAIIARAEQEAGEMKIRAEAESAANLVEIEKECREAAAQAERIEAEIENTKVLAAQELAGYVEEAKAAIAAAEEAKEARKKIDDEVRAIMEKADSYKAQADEAKRKADEESQAIYLKLEESSRLAQQEEQEILQRAQEAKAKAQKDQQVYLDELEATQKQVQAEIEKIQEERRALWAAAEAEAAALTKELNEAREMAKEATQTRQAAEEQAREAQLKAAEDAERIILEAEKRAIVLKEIGISESEKGRITKQYEDIRQSEQEKITALQEALEERQGQLEHSEQKVREMMEEIEDLRNSQLRTGFVPVSVPMEYEVEIIPHNNAGEVNSEGIASVLALRGPKGWKLHSLVNDEGGRLQASMIGSEKVSLTGTTAMKQDRVILIFERVSEKNDQIPSFNS